MEKMKKIEKYREMLRERIEEERREKGNEIKEMREKRWEEKRGEKREKDVQRDNKELE